MNGKLERRDCFIRTTETVSGSPAASTWGTNAPLATAMIAENERIALFNSPTRVMKADKALRQAGLPCRLIPAPREVAAGCALALRFTAADQAAIFAELGAKDLLPRRLYGNEKGILTPLGLPLPTE